MTALRVITFDLDDTLWDVRPALLHAEAEVQAWLAQHAPDLLTRFDRHAMQTMRAELIAADPSLVHQVSRLRRDGYAVALERTGYSHTEAARLASAAFAVFQSARNRVEPFPGVDALLADLGRRYVLGALSNGNAQLHRLPIGAHFAFHFSAEQVGAGKPDPAMFNAAATHSGVTPEAMLHVGDNPDHDVQGAANAGIPCVWISPAEREFPAQLSASPIARIDHVLQLPQVLAELAR